MKYFRVSLILLTIVYLFSIIIANRGLLFSSFDAAYWKDKYEHSQWKLPLSVRTLGDDGLYLYEGYRLTHGGDPTLLNAEVPPLGKYLIGYTIALFGNPYWFGFIVNATVLVGTYFLTKRLTRSSTISWLAVLLFATDPLFTNQYALTMLDSLQALFLILYCICILQTTKNKKSVLLYSALAGIALGFFSETKFPLLFPIPFLLGTWYVWKHTHSLRPIVMLTIGVGTGYLLPYTGYFLQGHTIIEWLKVQKWIVSFYLSSNLAPTYGSVLVNMSTGYFQNIFSHVWKASPHWSPMWPILLLTLIISFFRSRKKETLLFLCLLILGILSFYTVIPFWTRYLMLILPILYILLVISLRRLKPKILVLLSVIFVTVNILWSLPTFFPTPDGMLSLFTYSWKNNFLADLYEDISSESKKDWDRTSFREFGLNTIYDGEIEKVEIHYTTPSVSLFTKEITIPIRITYVTRHLGPFDIETTIPMKKENNRWKVVWDWNLYLPSLSASTRLETMVIEGKRGDILASDKKKLASDFPSVLISVTPKDIDPEKETKLLILLEKLFDRKILSVYFHQRIYGNTLSTKAIPIGVLSRILSPDEMTELTSYKGIHLTPHLGRHTVISDFIKIGSIANSHVFECCSLLYTTELYDGIEGVEKEKNTVLKGENGGTLKLLNENNQILQTFIQKTKKDGNNVQL